MIDIYKKNKYMKRYHIKTYRDFVNESVNEGLFKDTLGKIGEGLRRVLSKIPGLKWIGDRFAGTNSWSLNMYRDIEAGNVKGMTMYPGTTEMEILKAAESQPTEVYKEQPEMTAPSVVNPKEAEPMQAEPVEESEEVSEARIRLSSIDVENIGPDEFKNQLDLYIDFVASLGNDEEIPAAAYPKPLLVWGAPGIGKTAITTWKAESAGLEIRYCNLTLIDKDLFMLPGLSQDKYGTPEQILAPLKTLPVFNNLLKGEARKEAIREKNCENGGIIFFDELSRAPKSTINAILELAGGRVFADYKLAPKWIMIAASNRQEDEPETEMAIYQGTAAKDRFNHVNYVPEFESWKEYVKSDVQYNYKTKEYEKYFPQEMLDFIELNPDYWHNMDSETESLLQCSPRAWTDAARNVYNKAVQLGRKLKLEEIEREVAQRIRKDVAKEYVSFLQLLSHVDKEAIAKVYTDPKNAAPWPKKGSKTEAGENTTKGEAIPTITEMKDVDVNALRFAYRVAILRLKLGKICTPEEIRNFTTYILGIGDKTSTQILAVSFLKTHPELNLTPGNYDVDVYSEVSDEFYERLVKKYPDIFDSENEALIKKSK